MDTKERISQMKPSDKIIGVILLAVAAGAVGWGLFFLLPLLIVLAQNAVYFFLELAVALALAIVVLSPDTWRNAYYGWQNISRKIRKLIISSDPIGILNTVLRQYAAKLNEIDSNIVETDAATKRQKASIRTSIKSRDEELAMAKEAERLGKDLQVRQHAMAAQRWATAADEAEPMLKTLTDALAGLERARDYCAVQLEDYESQKEVLSLKLEAFQSGQKAIRKLKGFFGRNPEMEMAELAVEDIERKSTEAMAEIDQFMRVMTPKLDAQDLKRSAEQTVAMDKFNLFLTGAPKAALPASGAQPIPAQITSSETLAVKEKVR